MLMLHLNLFLIVVIILNHHQQYNRPKASNEIAIWWTRRQRWVVIVEIIIIQLTELIGIKMTTCTDKSQTTTNLKTDFGKMAQKLNQKFLKIHNSNNLTIYSRMGTISISMEEKTWQRQFVRAKVWAKFKAVMIFQDKGQVWLWGWNKKEIKW